MFSKNEAAPIAYALLLQVEPIPIASLSWSGSPCTISTQSSFHTAGTSTLPPCFPFSTCRRISETTRYDLLSPEDSPEEACFFTFYVSKFPLLNNRRNRDLVNNWLIHSIVELSMVYLPQKTSNSVLISIRCFPLTECNRLSDINTTNNCIWD